MENTLTLPTIHMNGTSAKGMLEDLCDALGAVCQAIEAVQQKGGPNARDYYPQGPAAFTAARKQHEDRLQKLIDVRRELEAIAEHVADQA